MCVFQFIYRVVYLQVNLYLMDTKDLKDSQAENQFGKAENTNETSVNVDATATKVASDSPEHDEEIDETLQPINIDEDTSIDEEHEEEVEYDDEEEDESAEKADYSQLTREELVEALKSILANKPIQRIRAEVESIKVNFYKKHKAEYEKKRKEFIEAGGEAAQFVAPEDVNEPQIKELLRQYREARANYNRGLEDEKTKNLETKQHIIEQIKELVNSTESVNHTFQHFRELQQKWRETGPVPQAVLNDLWETYHHHVQNFYDYIKINKELRDLDLKRNLEEKIGLCEKAEELLIEPSIVNAFKKLQKYHNQWREVGPVSKESRTEVWERFKEITSKINKKHQEFFESLRDEQKKNLDAKTLLCEKAEELVTVNIGSAKEWNKRSKEMIELQKVWKTIGFAPRKDNQKIYDRFRAACDAFFNKKRDFYADAREGQDNNLQLKVELCMQAEALKDSNEWKKATEELIALQKRWKEIGPVPRKHSDEVWKRFRAACDFFFNRKSEHFSKVDSKYEDNLNLKEQLIAEIEAFTLTDDVEANLTALKDFQRRWAEIGFVPIQQKDSIQKRYREAINKHFESLRVDEGKRNLLRFKSRIDNMQGNTRQENKMRVERDKLFNKLRQIENDITLWENNIGFFAKSKNAEQMIKDVEHKIERARDEIKMLEEKIKMIDNLDTEE